MNEEYLHEGYLVYDIVEIRDEIKKMTQEELLREIARIEEEHRQQKLKQEQELEKSVKQVKYR